MIIKTLLITGCTKGIGRALTIKFSKEDYKVYAVGRDQEQLNALAKLSENIHPICADITNTSEQSKICKVLKCESSLSIIHNAGVSSSAPFELIQEDALRQHFETNFFAPLLLTQELLPQLKGQRVLNISTGAAVMALESMLAYCTSKGAMHHATQCLNTEFHSHGIYFGNLRPGMVDTSMQETLRNTSKEILPTRDIYIRAKNEGKLVSPETVADFAAWVLLKTDATSFVENFWNIYDEVYQPKWLPPGGAKPTPL
jgi:NAD(P)-dependent dehydrogenase (short-subunit alcohol dehydrogenase family)